MVLPREAYDINNSFFGKRTVSSKERNPNAPEKKFKIDAKYLHKFVNEYDPKAKAFNFFNESNRLNKEA